MMFALQLCPYYFNNLGSLNKFNLSKDISIIGNTADKVPSAATIARADDSMDLNYLREVLGEVYLKAKRSKMINPYCGKWIGIIDAHEICSSDIHRCSLCSIRNVSKIESEIKLNYYHRYTAFILTGQKFCFMLDIEPIYPHEGELSSSYRLLERVCRDYPKAFEAVSGDALYLNGTTFSLLASLGKYAVAVLKDERRYLYEEAISLCQISAPVVYEEENTIYRVWDHTLTGMWDGYKGFVRVIRSEETKTVSHHCQDLGKWQIQEEKADWLWVINLPSVVSLKNVVSICHCRWQIENCCCRRDSKYLERESRIQAQPKCNKCFYSFSFYCAKYL